MRRGTKRRRGDDVDEDESRQSRRSRGDASERADRRNQINLFGPAVVEQNPLVVRGAVIVSAGSDSTQCSLSSVCLMRVRITLLDMMHSMQRFARALLNVLLLSFAVCVVFEEACQDG